MWKGGKSLIVKAKFLRNGIPSGRSYSYLTPDDGEEYKIGDYIYLKDDSIGIIDEINVNAENIGFPIEKLKSFIGRAVNPEIQIPEKGEE